MSILLPAGELAAMQATLASSLPETVTIQRVTLASNGAGGRTDTWATLATCSARIAPSRRLGKEDVHAGRLENQKLWTITLPAGQDVTPRDRIVWGARTFDVTGVNAARTYEVARMVEAVERA